MLVLHKAYLNEMKFLNLMVEVPRIFEFFQFFRSSCVIILSTYCATTNELADRFIWFKTDNRPFVRHDPSVFPWLYILCYYFIILCWPDL